MIRQTVRALCAASLVIAPLALAAGPAHAVTSCQVNGQPRSTSPMNNTISGTSGRDYITCSSVDDNTIVNGLGGNDYISVSGPVAGSVLGDQGSDYISTGSLASMTGAEVRGGPDNDYLRTGVNGGTVSGDLGLDYCRTAGGNPPTNCES